MWTITLPVALKRWGGAVRIRIVLSPGDAVPEFSVSDQDGEPFTDSDLRGKWTVLWWYPIADSPG